MSDTTQIALHNSQPPKWQTYLSHVGKVLFVYSLLAFLVSLLSYAAVIFNAFFVAGLAIIAVAGLFLPLMSPSFRALFGASEQMGAFFEAMKIALPYLIAIAICCAAIAAVFMFLDKHRRSTARIILCGIIVVAAIIYAVIVL